LPSTPDAHRITGLPALSNKATLASAKLMIAGAVVAVAGCGTAGHRARANGVEPRPARDTDGGRSPGSSGGVSQSSAPAEGDRYVVPESEPGSFPLAEKGIAAPWVVDAQDYPGVVRAVRQLQTDMGQVSAVTPQVSVGSVPSSRQIVVVGTLGKSALLERLVRTAKVDVSSVSGRWETFLIQVVDAPLPGVDRALVIAGADKRGTIYGLYDLSAQIGVSPWSYWADVPVRRQPELYVLPGRHSLGPPAVKYRGIFINDENPALLGMVREKFGGFKHAFYEKVFELLLRLKANTLWPAMWSKAFNDDDPMNPELADEYGIVMGTSHHEPMMRAQEEWKRYGSGPWDYTTNRDALQRFWRRGIERMGSHESIVTIGMRGDGDLAMTPQTNLSLLQKIVQDQRAILADVTGRDPAGIPQVWTLYKEVLDYYDQGLVVPEDVTLVFTDDNWGNLRRLPRPSDAARRGGYGVYYHFDYVGGPRSYKWLNTNQISRVWEQMHLAYSYGVDRLWLVNVGDIKPMEFPTEFFLDYAWNPDRWPAERLPDYGRLWAQRQFGSEHAAAIAEILARYTRYNSRRKPELLAPATYSLVDYLEAETVVAEYDELAGDARKISDALPPEYRDAFYQLVLYPVLACANLNDLYVTVARNALDAAQGRSATNDLAARARALFANDANLSAHYNHTMSGGKWNHLMDQTHIGYTDWRDPPANVMPEVREIQLPRVAQMGVAVEGSSDSWPGGAGLPVLPEVGRYDRHPWHEGRYIEVFNRGQAPFEFAASSPLPWLTIDPPRGSVRTEQRLWVSVDWAKAPPGATPVPIRVTGPQGSTVVIQANVNNPRALSADDVHGFVESGGYVSIEAEHCSRAVSAGPIQWQRIPEFGRTLSGMTPFPVTAPSLEAPGQDSPHLEYRVHLVSSGELRVRAYVAPTLDVRQRRLRYAVSFDDRPPQIVDILAGATEAVWSGWVRDDINTSVTRHELGAPGAHVLKFWMVDPGVVLEKLVVETTGPRPSYLGPPESLQMP
jgi:Glycosyl hydrolase family 115/Gylcosyl hydrolase family 115 C-terminal domain